MNVSFYKKTGRIYFGPVEGRELSSAPCHRRTSGRNGERVVGPSQSQEGARYYSCQSEGKKILGVLKPS
jgi:hypothetical protein